MQEQCCKGHSQLQVTVNIFYSALYIFIVDFHFRKICEKYVQGEIKYVQPEYSPSIVIQLLYSKISKFEYKQNYTF